MWEASQAPQATYDFVLHSAPRATVHVQPLHPWCVHSTFLSEKGKQPTLRFRVSLTKPKLLMFTTAP